MNEFHFNQLVLLQGLSCSLIDNFLSSSFQDGKFTSYT